MGLLAPDLVVYLDIRPEVIRHHCIMLIKINVELKTADFIF